MVKQHNTLQKNKDHAAKKLEDNWQQSPKFLEILKEGDGSEKWLSLTALDTQTAKDPKLARWCLNYEYVTCIIILGWNPKSVPPPNRQIVFQSPFLIFLTLLSEKVELSDLEAPTPSEPLPLDDLSSSIADTPDTTPNNVTRVVEAISGDITSSKMAVTPIPVRTKTSLNQKEA
ncbi:hypothetical protein K440DRAFT_641830 [Wilcoxina mikolae CBS 423.85]|nr:hypothetical protein K440DRAFT_641830 [Wilcoxina mikolae CBS 423.85]